MTHTSSRLFATMLGRGSDRAPKQIAKAGKVEQLELDMTRTARNSVAVDVAAAAWRRLHQERSNG